MDMYRKYGKNRRFVWRRPIMGYNRSPYKKKRSNMLARFVLFTKYAPLAVYKGGGVYCSFLEVVLKN